MGAGLEAQANYFSYFVVIAILCIVFYLVFHNKQKVSCCVGTYGFVRTTKNPNLNTVLQFSSILIRGGNHHRLNRLTDFQILTLANCKIMVD